ncbi:MAG: cyclic nucleotide-binding domain-containing protein [Leptospiraceae bacterium]|nr:cyclic nucleotide-binding domain-containing protein [Leptospiraceae bacterium]
MLNENHLKLLILNQFFSNVDEKEIKSIDQSFFELRTYSKGDIIVEQGQPSQEIFLILTGEVQIYKHEDGRKIHLIQRKETEFIGEMGLIDEKERSSSVYSVTDVEIVSINKENFYRLLENFPVININIRKTISERLRESDSRAVKEIANYEKLLELNRVIRAQKRELEILNQELVQQKETATKANSLKTKYITSVSHDLKSPILNIRNLLNLIVKSEDLSKEKIKDYLTTCIFALNTSYDLIHNLLNQNRFESGNIELDYTYINLHSTVNGLINEINFQSRMKELHFEISIDEDSIIIGDKYLITQLFLNFFSNAIKFSKPRGKIDIKIHLRDKNYSAFIEDEGIGMSKEDIETILSFANINSKPGTLGEIGTGLGIRICQQIIDLHNGKLAFFTNSSGGLTIEVHFPKQEVCSLCFCEDETYRKKIAEFCNLKEIFLMNTYNQAQIFPILSKIHPNHVFIQAKTLNEEFCMNADKFFQQEEMKDIHVYFLVNSELKDFAFKNHNFVKILDPKSFDSWISVLD